MFLCNFILILFFLSPLSGNAQDASPGQACSPDGSVIESGGNENAGNSYLMVCESGSWVRILETNTTPYVGVKQGTPLAPLDVGGELKIGTTTGLNCDSGREGAMRYSLANKCLDLCDGQNWVSSCVPPSPTCDNNPASFDFADLSNQSTSTQLTSSTLLITGTDPGCSSSVSISGDGSPQYRVCTDSGCTTEVQTWTSSTNSFDIQGRYLQIRATTGTTNNISHKVTINVGASSDTWTISTPSTGSCGVSPTVGDTCPDGTVFGGVSPDAGVHFYVAHCDLGMTWDGTYCTGYKVFYPYNNGNSSDYTSVAGTDALDGPNNTSLLIAADSDSLTAGTQPHQAAQACDDLNVHGHTDWYLPARDELQLIRQQFNERPDMAFGTGYYWTSTQNSLDRGWYIRGGDFLTGTSGKQSNYPVRCARRD